MVQQLKDKKLLKLCLSGFTDKTLDDKNFKAFSRDYTKYAKGELTFRELLAAIKQPKGELKVAMQSYYADSVYTRVFEK